MGKQVQIDFELFCDILDYFEVGGKWQGSEFLADEIRKGLNDKVNKIIARELFSRYKRTPTGVERETARQEYLNHRGVFDDFRSDEEWHESKLTKS